ncbi:MAG: CMP-binding protein [Planctomycetaceae bacterium]|nr:CMP-binding protein [Planctomycetaceae bacterium]
MPDRVYVKEMGPNQLVEGVYSVQNSQLGLTKNGKHFLKCLLGDRTGRLPGRMWNTNEEMFAKLPTNGFVYVEGQTQPYQGEIQIIISAIEGIKPDPARLADLLPCTSYDIDEMFAALTGMLEMIKSPSLGALAKAFLDDATLMEKFKQAPAAMVLHHAYMGGLLEHTLNLMRVADGALAHYPKINRDIVLMGIFIHDLGKCDELTWLTGFDYSDVGRLVGHVAIALGWLNEKAEHCDGVGQPIPEDALNVLRHIILSHHGQKEFGALVLPSTPEALMVSLLDNLDAKMQMAISAARGDDAPPTGDDQKLGGNFTEKVWALDTRLFRPDPLHEESSGDGLFN